MTPFNQIRLVQVAILSAIVAVSVGSNAALGKPMPRAAADVFERYVAAHPYGNDVIDTGGAPDAFERYVAAHPYGNGVIDTSKAPDVFERYVKSHGSPSAAVVDGRSPDTRDAAQTNQPIEIVTSGRFNWSDAGIGAATGGGLILLMGASMLLLLRTHRRHDVQAT